ncbi:64a09973-e2d6-4bbb-8aa8-b92e3e829c5b [Sclerotinia trifoliorum]|uniref:64a09973-e2d6-4bbb-8aa8-b92e3e829c5b n=1 Tax=Sclerotinia trifoliorum TaxID=28548 RepID=A0A8H2ZR09_9HELO|nr:64a09973-e2d6-4bbb-8aa8-b92e3e829c5b [Sclerotinia trifoliorum]
MGSKTITLGVLTLVLGVFYQTILKDWLYLNFGIGRTYTHLEDYHYKCRRLEHPLLSACEDLFLDYEGRAVYAACSTVESRRGWIPGGNHYNVSQRTLEDHVSVLKIDEPGEDGFYGLHQLEITGGYKGVDHHNSIDVHGFDVEILPDSRRRFWMINHRPPVDESENFLDATKLGANSTVEVFDLVPGSKNLEFVKTVANPIINTPNNIAATGDGGFVFSNDHPAKTGFIRSLVKMIGGGNIAMCEPDNKCHSGPSNRFPNGIVQGQDGLYYVASSMKGKISVYSLEANHTFTHIDEIDLRTVIDNLSVDANGDILAAGFLDVRKVHKSLVDPTVGAPSAAFRIRKLDTEDGGWKYVVTKILEDIDAKVLSAATSVVHDPKTGQLFFGCLTAPFIVVCEKV